MSLLFELRLTGLRKVLGIPSSEMFKLFGSSYKKMRPDQFIKLVDYLEARLDRIPELEEIPDLLAIKELIERQIGLLVTDYHRPREWLEGHLARQGGWQPYARIINKAQSEGFSIEDIQAAASRVSIEKKRVKGERCWRIKDEN